MYEWGYLQALLESGYPIVSALEMICPNTSLQHYLEQGMDINDILLQGQRGNFFKHLRFFLSIASIAEAIDGARRMDAFEKSIRKKLIQQTSYPLVLFVFAFATLYVFSTLVIPQLMQSFDMEGENAFLMQAVGWLRFLIQLLALLCLAILLLFIACKRNLMLTQRVLDVMGKRSTLPAQLCSYTLSGYLFALAQYGISTRDAFRFLVQLPSSSMVQRCASDLRDGLEAGGDLLELFEAHPFISTSFVQCWRIGMRTQNMKKALQDAMERQEEAWLRLIKRISIIIQSGAYSFVALMVILVYQIMLVPLQLLETM